MAQQGRNGHNHEENNDSYIFNPMSYNYHQHNTLAAPTVLSQQDANVMADFFENPDTNSNNYMNYGSGDGAADIAQHHAVTSDSAMINGQAAAVNFTPHVNAAAREPLDLAHIFFNGTNAATHTAGDAVAGASALLAFSTSEQADLLGANNYMGWNNYVGSHLQAPGNSASTATMIRAPPLRSNSTSQMHIASPVAPHANTWADITQSSFEQRTRHQSLQLDTNVGMAVHQHTWQREPLSAQPHGPRPMTVRFGSDNAFGAQGFTGQNGTPNEEKRAAFTQFGDRSHGQIGSADQNVAPYMHRHSMTSMSAGHTAPSSSIMFASFAAEQTPGSTMTNSMRSIASNGQNRKRTFDQIDNSALSGNAAPCTATASASGTAQNHHGNGIAISNGTHSHNANSGVAAQNNVTAAVASSSTAQTGTAAQRANASRRARNGNSRPPRMNLSDQQKRANHIASEQKRRDNMKGNFDTLGHRVPAVRDGGAMSRSEVLYHIANHIEATANGNRLMCQLAGIDVDDLDAIEDSEDEDDDANSGDE